LVFLKTAHAGVQNNYPNKTFSELLWPDSGKDFPCAASIVEASYITRNSHGTRQIELAELSERRMMNSVV